MAKVPLTGGFYQSRSLIANAQRCVNLYPELNPADSPFPITTYPTPGIDVLATGSFLGWRGLFRASNGDLYGVNGQTVYYINSSWALTALGTITSLSTPVSFQDNGLVIILVDGSTTGYAIDMVSRTFGAIASTYFYGATKVDYIDTFFIFNRPTTNQFYISLSEVTYRMLTETPGAILSGEIQEPGTLYTAGVYTGVALTGGSGTGAVATITIAGGAVTNVTLTADGQNYALGDSLSVNASTVGGTGSGFAYSVNLVAGGFDPLDIAAKTGYPDAISSLIVMHREIWIVGTLTTEIWYNSGAADFSFQQIPGAFIEHGCVAPYSLAAQDLSTYWLSQDKQGQLMVLKGESYQAKRISTHAIENEFMSYATVDDAIGFVYQQEGHVFYMLMFPTANKTWAYDENANLWHQRCWTDTNGILNRHRMNCIANAYGHIVIGDWQNGKLYALNLNQYYDEIDGLGPNPDGSYPMSFIRSFPHMVNDSNRIIYNEFVADMDVGEDTGAIDGSTPDNPPVVMLRWSDTKGKTWSNAIEQPLGAGGEYLTNVQFQRLGLARDRVFELSWSMPAKTALNGAFIRTTQSAS